MSETAAIEVMPREGSDRWTERSFADIAEHITDRIDDPSEAGVDRYVGLEHLDSGSVRLRRWGSPADVESTKLRFASGDVIFAKRRAYQRKLAQATFEGICSAHAMVLRAKAHSLLPEFLPFFMESNAFMERAVAISVGSLSPTINWKALARQRFRVPPLEEQRRIARIMWAFEEAAATQEHVLSQVSTAASALGEEVFGQATKLVRCADITERITVGIVVKPAQWYTEHGVPALRSLNVAPNRFDLGELVQLTEEGHAQHAKSTIRHGDVLVVRTGRPGDAAVATDEVAGMNCIDLILARCDDGLDPRYLSFYLNSSVARRRMAGRMVGTAQQHFNVTSLKQLEVPLRPIGEQRQVANRFGAVESLRAETRAQLDRLARARATVLDELLPDDVH